jgi:hypothetical protein
MKNQIAIMIMSMVLSVAVFVSATSSGSVNSVPQKAFGQSTVESTNEGNTNTTSNTRSNNNNRGYSTTDKNIVAVTSAIATNNSGITPSNATETIPTITVHDVLNSTYLASKGNDPDGSERRVIRAIRDRVNDLLHTVVRSNATITSTANITNEFTNESITINNNTRFLEILPDQLRIALDKIRTISQPANPTLEVQTQIETVCVANSISFADCNIKIKIR